MKSALSEVRRARPLLGTFVEISASGISPTALHRAIDCAFAVIERIHLLMSFHDSASDVSKLNCARAGRVIRVHAWTHHVLRHAQRFAVASHGCFDITIAPTLVKWKFLPSNDRMIRPNENDANYQQIELLEGNRVRFHREGMLIDLGGIAKGFAVDKAVAELKKCGVRAGLVNAGGDLRSFGDKTYPVAIRDPRLNGAASARLSLREQALATSAHYFAQKKWQGREITPIVDPHRRKCDRSYSSVSILAKNCLLADALTKIVMLRGEQAFPLLEKFRAAALLITIGGEILYKRPPTGIYAENAEVAEFFNQFLYLCVLCGENAAFSTAPCARHSP
jgi:thiamine biosynthesis lipoprotein